MDRWCWGGGVVGAWENICEKGHKKMHFLILLLDSRSCQTNGVAYRLLLFIFVFIFEASRLECFVEVGIARFLS